MNSRRKFLMQGSFATTALLICKPFTSLANSLAPVSGYRINNNKLVLIHTGNGNSFNYGKVPQDIATLKQQSGNLVVLHAGNDKPAADLQPAYDASLNGSGTSSVAAGDYKIIYKGDIKTGIITAGDGSTHSINAINNMAAYLKKEKNCHLVVCLSQLGFRSKNNADDLTLATESTHIDIIIGGHAKNYCKRPFITLNKNREEVIINHTAGNILASRKIEIAFDDRKKKHAVAITRTVPGAGVTNEAASS